jgi:6,7-dimethyl-8-ribityllumazine synthase
MSNSDQSQSADIRRLPTGFDGRRIAFVQANWHKEIVDQGRESFLEAFEASGGARDQVDVFDVPGSYEIPLQAKLIAKSGDYAAIVAAGFVVDGGIYRHEFVARAVLNGLMKVQLETEIPILSMVLTPLQFHGHSEHVRFFQDHFKIKGAEAAEALVNLLKDPLRAKAL